jgi:hypothetical protein
VSTELESDLMKHYVVQAGLRNAPPDDVEVRWSLEDAIAVATSWYGLSELEQSRLALFGYSYLDILDSGADYVEVYACQCASPHWHYATVERREEARDFASHITVSVV